MITDAGYVPFPNSAIPCYEFDRSPRTVMTSISYFIIIRRERNCLVRSPRRFQLSRLDTSPLSILLVVLSASVAWTPGCNPPKAFATRISVAGENIFIRCEGTRHGPAVIFESGNGGTATRSQPRMKTVQRLHALLAKAGIVPPYVMVGHSYGGMLARGYSTMFHARRCQKSIARNGG